jgi:hypothetical protein
MLNSEKMDKIMALMENVDRSKLFTRVGRRQLGKKIALEIGMFEGRVQEFMNELDGIDWNREEDYHFFIQYIENGL